MKNNKTKIIEIIKENLLELVDISNSYFPDIIQFELKYNKLMEYFVSYIDIEDNVSLIKNYKVICNQMKSYESRPSGIKTVRSNYNISIKPKASKKSKSKFEDSIRKAANHIQNDFNIFFDLIPKDDNE